MRTDTILRAGVTAGALPILCLSAGAATAQATVPMKLTDARIGSDERTAASGRAGRGLAGRRVALELRVPAGAWRAVGAATVRGDGQYRVSGRIARSGVVRVTVAGTPETSATRRVRVVARLRIARRRLDVVAGRRASVRGSVRPGVRGQAVALQIRVPAGWRTIARNRTDPAGRFSLGDRRRRPGSTAVRVRVSGRRAGVGSGTRALGRLDVYRSANASWYGPGLFGNRLGCGGTLRVGTLGVAHKTLPCGTQVTFRKGSRSVRVRVIDRGPYVGGREYDLTAATARRLGFRGHGSVLATR